MGLCEHLYLSATVEGFSDGAELLVLGSGLAAGLIVLGGLLGALLFLILAFPAGHAVAALHRRLGSGAASSRLRRISAWLRRISAWLRRISAWLRQGWVLAAVGVLGFIGIGVGFWVNARAYHRLYAGYHGTLSGLTFAAGLVGSLCVIALLRRRVGKAAGRRLRWLLAGAGGVSLVGAVAMSPRLVTNENLKAIVSDRGVTSCHVLMVLRALHDRDGDGFASLPFGYDCDDANACRYPMRYDAPENGLDEDCTGADRSRPPARLPAPPASSARRAGAPERILMLTVDALRADRWPDYCRRRLLPNVYRLSRRGAAFHRAYATSNWTLPSVYSLMTGRYPSQVRFLMAAMDWQDNVRLLDPESDYARDRRNMRKLIPAPARDDAPTLAEALQQRGYRTATVLDNPFLKPAMGMTRGFDIVDETPYQRANRNLQGITAPLMAKQAWQIIERHAEKRLFLYAHFSDPHAPYHRHTHPTNLGDRAEDRYDSELRFVDQWIGYLLQRLQQKGLLRSSLIIITADHGEEFRDHGGRYHASTVYEEQIRVPLVLVGPGIVPLRTIQPVSLVDVTPTVLSLVDGTADRDLASGMDLSRWLRSGRFPPRLAKRVLYAESRRFQNWKQACITNRYKLVRDNKAATSQLFDLHRDRGEHQNLIGQEPALARRLLERMRALLDR